MPAAKTSTRSSESAGQKLRFRTFGGFVITAPDGSDLTPRTHKAHGVMAILLTSPGFRRPRAKLQDLLWSDRDPSQGAASLRQELTVLRKALGAFSEVLQADRAFVWLDGSKFETDCDANGPTALAVTEGCEFLEGSMVRDPEFVDWLRDRRLAFEDSAPSPQAQPPPDLPARTRSARPTLYLSFGAASGPLSAYVARAISGGVQDWAPVDVSDVIPPEPQRGALLLETEEVRFGNDAFVQVVLKDAARRSTLWRSALEFDMSGSSQLRIELSRLINDSVDRTLTSLSFDLQGIAPQNANAAIQAIEKMFATHGDAYEVLARIFEDEFATTGHGVFLAWRAFLTTYVVGAGQARDRAALAEEARDFMRRALLCEPHNPLVMALCAHVNGFTLGDHQSAFELADRSVRLQSNNPLGWMFRGTALMNLGRLDEGRASIARARDTSGEAPYRYLIDCYSCIAEMLSQDTDSAVRYARTSLNYAPDFAPTLRYLLATYLNAGDMEAAEKTIERLKRVEPDFELPYLAEPEYPVPLMKKYGVLDLKRLSKLL